MFKNIFILLFIFMFFSFNSVFSYEKFNTEDLEVKNKLFNKFILSKKNLLEKNKDKSQLDKISLLIWKVADYKIVELHSRLKKIDSNSDAYNYIYSKIWLEIYKRNILDYSYLWFWYYAIIKDFEIYLSHKWIFLFKISYYNWPYDWYCSFDDKSCILIEALKSFSLKNYNIDFHELSFNWPSSIYVSKYLIDKNNNFYFNIWFDSLKDYLKINYGEYDWYLFSLVNSFEWWPYVLFVDSSTSKWKEIFNFRFGSGSNKEWINTNTYDIINISINDFILNFDLLIYTPETKEKTLINYEINLSDKIN